jgi:pyruvate/2-oxoacid:ferredoxin oxidoreductase alpha subunit
VLVLGSGAECAREAAEFLAARGERVGVVKVRLFRPFSVEHLIEVLPPTVQSIAALDRTKEPGSSGEPLLQELSCALVSAVAQGTLSHIGEQTGLYAQGHFEYDSRQAGSTTVSYLRFGPQPIRSTYY